MPKTATPHSGHRIGAVQGRTEFKWGDALVAPARALATYTSLLAPELIVIGGGLSGAGDVLLEPLRARLQELLVWQQVPRIVVAQLGENAACLGAGSPGDRAYLPA